MSSCASHGRTRRRRRTSRPAGGARYAAQGVRPADERRRRRGGGRASGCGCREPHPPGSGDHPVVMDEAAQTVGSSHLGGVDVVDRRRRRVERGRRMLGQRAAGVVVRDVPGEHGFEVAASEDDHVVEAFAPDGADHAPANGVRPGLDRGLDAMTIVVPSAAKTASKGTLMAGSISLPRHAHTVGKIRAPRAELGHPLRPWVAHRPQDLPPQRQGQLLPGCVCLTVNDVGEPDDWRASCPCSIGGGWQSRGSSGQMGEKPLGQRSVPRGLRHGRASSLPHRPIPYTRAFAPGGADARSRGRRATGWGSACAPSSMSMPPGSATSC